MGPPSYMRSVVDRTSLYGAYLYCDMQTSRHVYKQLILYSTDKQFFQDIIYNGTSTDGVRVRKSNIVWNLTYKLAYLLVSLSMLALNGIHRLVSAYKAPCCHRTQPSLFSSLGLFRLYRACMSPAVISTTSSIKHTSTFLPATLLNTTATYRGFHKNNSDIP